MVCEWDGTSLVAKKDFSKTIFPKIMLLNLPHLPHLVSSSLMRKLKQQNIANKQPKSNKMEICKGAVSDVFWMKKI